jgi:hypothetical protein
MRFFHQTHFGLWGRPQLLARSDSWFIDALQNATACAHQDSSTKIVQGSQ